MECYHLYYSICRIIWLIIILGFHLETYRCEYLLEEHQCLLLKQHIIDIYNITLPSLPSSFNSKLWTGKWDIIFKQVNSEPEFAAYTRLAKTAVRMQRNVYQLELAREKFKESITSGGKFVSIDVECFEFDHRRITELGISTIMLPGGKINSRHLLIKEYAHLRNHKFVPNRANAFDHGKSEWIHLKECTKFITEALHTTHGGPVYFIGHDPMADIKYLEQNLKYSFPEEMNIFDTRMMFSAFGGDSILRNLAHCLEELGIEHCNLHNAGTSFNSVI